MKKVISPIIMEHRCVIIELIKNIKKIFDGIGDNKITFLPLSRSAATPLFAPVISSVMRRHFNQYQPMLSGLDRKIQPGFGAQARR
ncbi:hypothetical protein [Hymenobacter rigui]|uniref:Uncharacterized protein n=1 Tax=Hymenobacter rigui TaxID=334424 RepID=A0A3R9PVS3_9BACT|nr:hypothetical protein [Hymenobacter rigui]RSK47130.1 hypothetical protein EI291_16155 [Hymenobacter rigui]